jgi:acyl carrier protein
MSAGSLVSRVAAVIARVVGPERTPPDAGADTPLAGGGFWLDSVALLEVIVACEAEFDVSFDPDTDLTPEALATVGSLAQLVAARRSS